MPNRRMKILINTNSMWSPSGYGQQASYLIPMMRDEGYEMAVSNFYGLEGGIVDIEGIRQYPKIADTWGADAMVHHSRDFGADIVMTLQDLWVLDPKVFSAIPPWIPYVPIDHDPIPPAIFARLKNAYRIVSMSEFGHSQLKDRGLHSTFIPHFVDTEIYKPGDRSESRKLLSVPEDLYLFGMVSANKDNPPRKSFQEVMDAFKIFHDKYPKSAIYFHTNLTQQGGFNIEDYARFIGINGFVYKIDIYNQMFKIDKAGMAKIFNAFDCLLMPSTNEGFGIPAIEAQACGVPVITNDFTSMPEMIIPGVTGELCRVLYKRFTPLGSYIGVPDYLSIYQAMEKVYKGDREAYRKNTREHALKKYSTKGVWENKWKPFFAKVEKEVLG